MKAIITKFYGGTVARPSRYDAWDGDGNRVTSEADDALNSEQNHEKVLRKLCRKMGWNGRILQGGLMKDGHLDAYVWVWRDEGLQHQTMLHITP